ncbi:hypothetical protein TTHERM_00396990 (macronuclear) [Tetrahymena thermophila SB210]|uniref:Cyclic nucleotide-binding domain protein n=1 Tax=Tetrahymena thermophila (strain SB210) TaxID=312017 RepID=Q232V3_TETTS|nr:hypothetical protein TTHERM_00396990 [Tetrahymena thermophila SB210]EAR91727.2 hypothetical protein TTHERM_00396990 [Tetrahymena thermophila SB210]|eukprot:XP_001011972.2 hypothetical protein TTHERM_00396990 [Tetrahymena thermophila SB210]
MLKKVPIFKEILNEQVFSELALQMKEWILCPDQIIINQQEEENETFIYFVNDGSILEYCQQDSKTKIKEIQVKSFFKLGLFLFKLYLFQKKKFRYGQHFGLVKFIFGDQNSTIKYKSVGVSSILQLSYSNFMEILKKYDIEYQKFCYARDEVRFQSKFQKVYAYCYSCLQKNHTIEQCPYLFYEGKKSQILRKYLQECDTKIKNYQRNKNEKTLNAVINQIKVQKSADQFYLQNIQCFSFWDLSEESDSEVDEEDEDQSEEDDVSSMELKQQKDGTQLLIEQKVGELKKKGSIIDDQLHQLCERKCSFLIQKEFQNQLDQGEINSCNSLNKQNIISGIIPSKLFYDQESIILEENQNNQANNKKNKSQKKLKSSEQNLSNAQDYEQLNNIISQTKIQTYQKLERCQTQSSQAHRYASQPIINLQIAPFRIVKIASRLITIYKNQSLGDQSQSLTQFPSQLQVNVCKNQKENKHNESKSEICYFQSENQKNGSMDQSFMNNQYTTQYKTFEQNLNITNYENTEMCNEISKFNESVYSQNKRNVAAVQSIFNQKQNVASAFPVNRKNYQHKTINYTSAFNMKEENKIGVKQRGFKKRNNLLDIDRHAQQELIKVLYFLDHNFLEKYKFDLQMMFLLAASLLTAILREQFHLKIIEKFQNSLQNTLDLSQKLMINSKYM